MLKPLVHIAQQAIHVGQARKENRGAPPEGVVNGRISGDDSIGFDRGGNACLRRGDDVVTDTQVASSAHLASQQDVSPYFGASGQPYLSAEERILAHFAPVSDLHQIVDLHIRGDDGVSNCRAINGRIRSDLDPVGDDHAARLGDLIPAAFGISRVAEAIGSDSRSVMDDDVRTDDCVLSDCHMRMDDCMCTDAHIGVDHAVWVDRHMVADLAIGGDDRIGTDGDMGSELRAWVDERRGMDPQLWLRRAIEQFQGLSEGEVRIGGSQQRHWSGGEIFGDDHGRSARRLDEGSILRIRDEGQLPGLSLGDRGDARDLEVLAIELCPDVSSDLGEPHGDLVHDK